VLTAMVVAAAIPEAGSPSGTLFEPLGQARQILRRRRFAAPDL